MSSIQSRWTYLHGGRAGVLRRARDAAALTIPSLLPQEGHNESSELPQPYQSLGARGVNNLSSKLLLALMPPSTSFFRLKMDEDVREEMGAKRADAEEALRRIESRVSGAIEKSNLRTVMHMSLKHMIVTGNALLYMPKSGRNRMFPLDRYCVTRSADGRVVEIVIKETLNPMTLPMEVQVACQCQEGSEATKERRDVDVYTLVSLVDEKHVYHQEINDIKVPGSDGETPEGVSPFLPMRWTAVSNEDYGRGHVEEYTGDLRSLEGLSMAIVSFAAAAARIVPILSPNSAMDIDDLMQPSGTVIIGNRDDVSILQLEKFNDFQVSKAVIDDLSLRLSHAFLMSSGTVRNAERVTAEEIRLQAQELEDVLGGVYTVQSQETQLPIVNRQMHILTQAGKIVKLPGVSPSIVTGFEALGRGHELNKLRAYFADALNMFGDAAMQYFRTDTGLKMLATSHNVDVEDLIKTAEEIAEEQQQAQMAAMMEKAAGPLAGAAGKAMTTTEE